MYLNEYQKLAQRTSSTDTPFDKRLNGALGLIGESGEVADIIKKVTYQGKEMDTKHLHEELGDVLWYVAETATGLEKDLSGILAAIDGWNVEFHEIVPDPNNENPVDTLCDGAIMLCAYCSATANFCRVKELTDGARTHIDFVLSLVYQALYKLAVMTGTTMNEIAENNIAKLMTRYPDGFDAYRSNHREE